MRTLILFIAATVAAIIAWADDTTRGGTLRIAPGTFDKVRAAAPDTMTLADGNVTASGYDKPLRANREAMFLTNHTGVTLTGVELEIVYLDIKDRELHRRRLWVKCMLPHGATRRVDFTSWDTQHTFFYVRGVAPRRDRTAPYDVDVRAVRATI